MSNYYPESKIEVSEFTARHYDLTLNIATFGQYPPFIRNSIVMMQIEPEDRILDLGAGTGRNACLMMKYLSDKGELIGVDISEEMIAQFKKKCADYSNANVIFGRLDQPLPFKGKFDKVFMSFVLHGFPQNIRISIVKGIYEALKDNGSIFILDYNEFNYNNTPFFIKAVFKFIECPYAFDYIKRDWKRILADCKFSNFEESFFFRNYVRLLKATKNA
ncbi:class I SAM-dependent methyltransferase [bacterium]|nr:class I SAM-dependent methyltransferase [bacterium]